MKPHALQVTNAKRRESVVVLQAPELALHGDPATVVKRLSLALARARAVPLAAQAGVVFAGSR